MADMTTGVGECLAEGGQRVLLELVEVPGDPPQVSLGSRIIELISEEFVCQLPSLGRKTILVGGQLGGDVSLVELNIQ